MLLSALEQLRTRLGDELGIDCRMGRCKYAAARVAYLGLFFRDSLVSICAIMVVSVRLNVIL